MDRAGERGVSEKTMFVHMGEGGVRGLSTWTKMFYGFPFCAYKFKYSFGIDMKSLKESGFVTLRLQERYLLLLKKS